MNIVPMADWIVLKQMDAPEKIGLIHLPETKREETRQRPIGVVVAAGPDVNNVAAENEHQIDIGDVLCYVREAGRFVYGLDGDIVIMVKREYVIGVVTSDPIASAEKVAKLRARDQKIMEEQQEQHRKSVAAASLNVSPGISMPRLSE